MFCSLGVQGTYRVLGFVLCGFSVQGFGLCALGV